MISNTFRMSTRIQRNCLIEWKEIRCCQNVWRYITNIYNNASENLLQSLQIVVHSFMFFQFTAKYTDRLFSIAFVSVLFFGEE